MVLRSTPLQIFSFLNRGTNSFSFNLNLLPSTFIYCISFTSNVKCIPTCLINSGVSRRSMAKSLC